MAILLHGFIYTEEPIDFCVKNGDRDNAIKHIKKVYKDCNTRKATEIYEELDKNYTDSIPSEGVIVDNAWNSFTSP